MILFGKWRRDQRAAAAVELALIAALFLMPLLAGSADFIIILAARAQLNTALQALYSFATTSPAKATDHTTAYSTANQIISAINAANGASAITVTMPANSTIPLKLGSLVVPAGTAMPATYYGCYSTGTASITYQTSACDSTLIQQTYVLYQLSGTAALPLYLPGFSSSYVVTAGGGIQAK